MSNRTYYGDRIKSDGPGKGDRARNVGQSFRDNYDGIFRKKPDDQLYQSDTFPTVAIKDVAAKLKAIAVPVQMIDGKPYYRRAQPNQRAKTNL